MENTQSNPNPETNARDPFVEEASSWRCASAEAAFEAAREAGQQVEEAAMSLLPVEVTRHLVNAQQELVRAGVRIAALASTSADKFGKHAIDALEAKAARAEALHAAKAARNF